MTIAVVDNSVRFPDNSFQFTATKVYQVKNVDWGTISYIANSTTNVDFTGFNATFTPLFSTSKVLVQIQASANFICDGVIILKRNGTIVKNNWFGTTRGNEEFDYPNTMAAYLDSPATTSTITYQIAGRATGCVAAIRFGSSGEGSSNITFWEIAA